MQLLADIAILLWLCWLSYGLGSFGLRSFGKIESGPLRAYLSLVAGFGLFSLGIFALGIPHAFRLPVIVVLLCACTIWLLLTGGVKLWNGLASGLVSGWGANKLCCSIILLVILTALGGACTPEVRGDPIIYHISEALLFLVHRGHVDIPSSALTYIPQNQQLVYALGLMLGDDSLPKLLHWAQGVLLLFGTGVVGRLFGLSLRQALAAAALIALLPVWTYLATASYIDLATANYIVAGFLSLEAGMPLLAGAFMGLAMGTKYTAIIVGFLPAFLLLLSSRAYPRRMARLISFSGAAAIVFSPWLIRNLMWTGNPFAPSLMRLLGPRTVPSSTLNWPDIQMRDVSEIWPPLKLGSSYLSMLLSLGDYGYNLPLITIIAGLLGLALKGEVRGAFYAPPIRRLVIFCAIAFLLGVPSSAVRRDARYVMGEMALLAAAVVYWCSILVLEMPRHRSITQRLGTTVLCALSLLWAMSTWRWFSDLHEWLIPIAGKSARAAYCSDRINHYDANAALGAANLKFDGEVLGAAYPARVPYVLDGAPMTSDLLQQNPENATPEDLPGYRRQGIHYLFGRISPGLAPVVKRIGEYGGVHLWEIKG